MVPHQELVVGHSPIVAAAAIARLKRASRILATDAATSVAGQIAMKEKLSLRSHTGPRDAIVTHAENTVDLITEPESAAPD